MAWGLPEPPQPVWEGDVPPHTPNCRQHPAPGLLSCSQGWPCSCPGCDSRLVADVSPGPSGVAEMTVPTGTMQALGMGGAGGSMDGAMGGCWGCSALRLRQALLGSVSLPDAQHLALALWLCHTAPPGTSLRHEAWPAEGAPTFQTPPRATAQGSPASSHLLNTFSVNISA